MFPVTFLFFLPPLILDLDTNSNAFKIELVWGGARGGLQSSVNNSTLKGPRFCALIKAGSAMSLRADHLPTGLIQAELGSLHSRSLPLLCAPFHPVVQPASQGTGSLGTLSLPCLLLRGWCHGIDTGLLCGWAMGCC